MPQNQVFISSSHFHFNECDPAGIFYFANVPNLCHRTYESWLNSLQADWSHWFNNKDWIIPIKNCSVDYLSPMPAGAPFSIHLSLEQMSQSSFTTHYCAFHPETKINYFKANIVHVFADKKTFRKTSIPENIRSLFTPYVKAGT